MEIDAIITYHYYYYYHRRRNGNEYDNSEHLKSSWSNWLRLAYRLNLVFQFNSIHLNWPGALNCCHSTYNVDDDIHAYQKLPSTIIIFRKSEPEAFMYLDCEQEKAETNKFNTD